MGLDMNLYRRRYANNPDDFHSYNSICYWGKRWPIFDWFERHLGAKIENCKYYPISKELLIQLRDDCYSVLKEATDGQNLIDSEKAAKYIPIDEEDVANHYDELYVDLIAYTLEKSIDAVLYTDFDDAEISFHADW